MHGGARGVSEMLWEICWYVCEDSTDVLQHVYSLCQTFEGEMIRDARTRDKVFGYSVDTCPGYSDAKGECAE
jgi:hypothetical protein